MQHYTKTTTMPCSAETLFSWHKKKGAFARLMPPWERMTLLHNDASLEPGSKVHFKVHKGPFSIQWLARHTAYQPPKSFTDIQEKGPFKHWEHEHRIISLNDTQSQLEDALSFSTPLNLASKRAYREVERMFHYRHTLLANDLEVQRALPSPPLTVAITGASGMVGSALSAFLSTAGHRVLHFVRRPSSSPTEISWNPAQGKLDPALLEGIDAIVNLCGDNIGSGRWTQKKKERIHQSRIQSTRLLVNTLNRLQNPPKSLISASAIGYYGIQCPNTCTESSPPGLDFLASVCQEWERESQKFTKGRCVTARIGVILSSSGGALAKMLLPFQLGLGGILGSGKQHLSWISLDDIVYALYRLLINQSLSGPFNLCAPTPATNYELTKKLGSVLSRPTIFPLPAFAAKLLFGEMADATLLASCPASPEKLQQNNHKFYFSDLEAALRHTLGK